MSWSWTNAGRGALAGGIIPGVGIIPGGIIGGFTGGNSNRRPELKTHEAPKSFSNLPDAGAQSAYNAPDFSDNERQGQGANMYGGMPQMGQMPQQPQQPQPNTGGMPGMGQSAAGTMGLSQPSYGMGNRMTGMAPSMRPMGGGLQGRMSMHRPQFGGGAPMGGQIPYPAQGGMGGQGQMPQYGSPMGGRGEMGGPQGGMQSNNWIGDLGRGIFGSYGPKHPTNRTDLGRGNVNPAIQTIRNGGNYRA